VLTPLALNKIIIIIIIIASNAFSLDVVRKFLDEDGFFDVKNLSIGEYVPEME